MNPTISVIIPCYHVLEYLDDLFECIEKQTFKDAEFIFVNDGDEGLSEKLNDFSHRDEHVIVIEKANGGPSSARNAGLDVAKGEWIAFCDPDDQFDGKYLQNLYDGVKEGAELVIGGFTKLFNISSKEYTHDFSIHLQNGQNRKTYNVKDALQAINFLNMVSLWNKLYRRKTIELFHLRFDEKAFVCEDLIFNFNIYKQVSIISLIHNCGYYYLIRNNSSITSTYKKNFQYARWQQMIKENELLDIMEYDEQTKKRERIIITSIIISSLFTTYFKKQVHIDSGKQKKKLKNWCLPIKRQDENLFNTNHMDFLKSRFIILLKSILHSSLHCQ